MAYGAISGPDKRDPLWTAAPLYGSASDHPVRVAVVRDPGDLGVNSHVAAGVQKAADALIDAGYDVADAEPPVMDAYLSWRSLITTDIRLVWPTMQSMVSAGAQRFMEAIFEIEPPAELPAYAAGLASRLGIARAWAEFQGSRPLILGPVCTNP